MKKHLICILFATVGTFVFSAYTAYAQSRSRPADVDSVLYRYFQRCAALGDDPEVLKVADTLFRLSGEKGDIRMQAAALSYKVDYYFFNDQKDSMLARIKVCQEFSQKNNQPKYYYFTWNRLVSHYRNRREYNLALFELGKMFEHAKKEGYKDAIYQCQIQIANIYLLKNQYEIAIEYYDKALDYARQNGVEDYNLYIVYYNFSQAFVSAGKYKQALDMLDSSSRYIPSSRDFSQVSLGRFTVLLAMGKPEKARSYLERALREAETPEKSSISRREILKAQVDYYDSIRQYSKAMDFLRELDQEFRRTGIEENNDLLWSRLYEKTGDTGLALQRLKSYLRTRLLEETKETRSQLGEFATLMGVERLSSEKNQLELTKQQDRLVYNRRVVFILSCLLILGAVFLFFQSRSNRRLRHSESALRRAVERTEKANQVKTAFIQHVTHEFRTPLNSIVGFSELIASQGPGDESREYIETLRANNSALLRLMEDVLCISDLESISEIEKSRVDVLVCCRESLEMVRSRIQPGVALVFLPSSFEPAYIVSSRRFLTEALVRLLDNAVKFTVSGCVELAYSFSPAGRTIRITVSDTGPGIREGWEEKIFERFSKGDSFSPGLGLGLPIACEAAQKLGGTLVLDREYTPGSRFVLTLPVGPS